MFKGTLEICKISIRTDSSFNKAVFKRYKDVVKDLYINPMHEEWLGSLLLEEYIPTKILQGIFQGVRRLQKLLTPT